MQLITNIQEPLLSDILLKQNGDFKKIKMAVAYCTSDELFKHCKDHSIKLDYYARLDPSINLNLEKLKAFLTDDISIHIVGGSKFHPKVIWCDNYGAYIGSANLTKSAWESNIECGLWLRHDELEDNNLIEPLDNFFKFIQEESRSLRGMSKENSLKFNKHTKDISELNKKKESIHSEVFLTIKQEFGIFSGCSNKKLSYKRDVSGKYREDSGWNDLNEMRCLLILKKLEAENFPQGKQEKLCREMSKREDINLNYDTINMKVGNYRALSPSGKKGLSGYSKNTERIYKKYKDTSIKELEKIIEEEDVKGGKKDKGSEGKKLKIRNFFKNIKKEIEEMKEMEGLEMGSMDNTFGVSINLKPIKYKGIIKIYRPENKKGAPYVEVCYTYYKPDVNRESTFDIEEDSILRKRLFHLTKKEGEFDGFNGWRPFHFKKDWGTEEEDKKWIIDRTIDLLKALRD